MKSKNISIKKLTENQHRIYDQDRKYRNSRKSYQMGGKQMNETKHSPITLIHTNEDEYDSSQSNDNFLDCINGYLNQLDLAQKQPSSDSLGKVKQKLQKEKIINRSLQKNLIQFQKILWERTEKLQKLQNIVQRLQSKQNRQMLVNQVQYKKNQFYSQSEEDEGISFTKSQIKGEYEKGKRRKTEIPRELEKAISKTIEMRKKRKGNNFF